MLELSIFADESGDKSDHAKYYLLTLVFHNQADSIIDQVMTYERSLADADLPKWSIKRPLRGRFHFFREEYQGAAAGDLHSYIPSCGIFRRAMCS